MTAQLTSPIKTEPTRRWPWARTAVWSRLDIGQTNGELQGVDIRPGAAIVIEMLEGSATAESVFVGEESLLSGTRQVFDRSGRQSAKQTIGVDTRNRKWLELKWRHFARAGREERIARALAALERAVIPYRLDTETAIWLAEDPDLEDL